MAELFSGLQEVDDIYATKLGLTHLVREAMSASNLEDLTRLMREYGGTAMGSFCNLKYMDPQQYNALLHYYDPLGQMDLVPTRPGAIFYDCSHDNEVPAEKTSIYNTLPMAALVSLLECAVGSSRGVDELIISKVRVVDEVRKYRSWMNGSHDMDNSIALPLDQIDANRVVQITDGIIAARACFNQLHAWLIEEGFTEIVTDRCTDKLITVLRYCPTSHRSVLLVAFPVLDSETLDHSVDHSHTAPEIKISGTVSKVIYAASPTSYKLSSMAHMLDQENLIQGTRISYHQVFNKNAEECTDLFTLRPGFVVLGKFPPGSVLILDVLPCIPANSLRLFHSGGLEHCLMTRDFGDVNIASIDIITEKNLVLSHIIHNLTLLDLNFVLFRCVKEEQRDGSTDVGYVVPNMGMLNFCGLHSIIKILSDVASSNNMAHPLCDNIRQGDWLMQYIANRLMEYPPSHLLGRWLSIVFYHIASLPRCVIPVTFARVISVVYSLSVSRALHYMSSFIINSGSCFVQRLALTSVQLYGYNKVPTVCSDTHIYLLIVYI